jgi:hypothetical protein
LPPEKWVPGYSYIPKIDKSWVVCKYLSSLEESSEFTVKGQIKNPNPNNIKFEVFDINEFNEPASPLFQAKEDYLEEEINPNFNAVNLGPIAKLIKTGEEWRVFQFIKTNYPFTEFFDANFYEKCNTERFNLNLRERIDEEDKEESLVYQNWLNKKKVFEFLRSPTVDHARGYIKYTKNTLGEFEHKILEGQYKFPPDYDYVRLENLDPPILEDFGGY